MALLLPALLSLAPLHLDVPDALRINERTPIAVVAFAVLIAPSLFLAGLINIQKTDRRRGMVMMWAMAICVGTAPFGIGLLLCIPVFVCSVLPMVRVFRERTLPPQRPPES